MFSATKFIVAGVIVALFGGFLLAGVLTQPSDESTPAAATDDASMAMSRFTVLGRDDSGWSEGVSVTDEGLLLGEGNVEFGFIETTDPRISGETVIFYNVLLIDEETGTGEDGVSVSKLIIANAGGRWIGTDTVLEGVDGYAGLTAVLGGWGPEGNEGVIFPGDMPPTPKDWCQLARGDFAAATSQIPDDEIGFVKDMTSRLCPSMEMP